MIQEELTIKTVQCDIIWEDRNANLAAVEQKLYADANNRADIIVLPEMFSTGFSANAQTLAEPTWSVTLENVRKWARELESAIIGSFIAEENGKFLNRGFFMQPDGHCDFYDKKHLFIGGEKECFSEGDRQLIVNYKGWNISLIICYDLRFPVWIRNRDCAYDLLICIAEWPVNRQSLFECLLMARAIENQAYVIGCNRVGCDGNNLKYAGGSQLIDYRGKQKARCEDNSDCIGTFTISHYPLESHREKVPVWQDGDNFELKD